MRKIQIYLNTSSNQVDDGITAMQFLKELKNQEKDIDMEVSFFLDSKDITKMLHKAPNAMDEFFEQSPQDDPDNPMDSILERNGVITETDGATTYNTTTDDTTAEDTTQTLSSGDDYYLHTKFHIPISREQPKCPAPEKIIFIFNNPSDSKDESEDQDLDNLDLLKYMKCMFCSCVKVPRSGDVSHILNDLYTELCEVPNTGVFEFDSEDLLKINLVLHLIALKVLYRRNLSVRQGKVYYRNLYVGDLSNTPYTIETVSPELALKMGNLNPFLEVDDIDISDPDQYYSLVLRKAIMLSGLSYSAFDPQDEESAILSLLCNIYECARYGNITQLRQIYQSEEKERNRQMGEGYAEAYRQKLIALTRYVYDAVEEDNALAEEINDPEFRYGSGYLNEVIRKYAKIIRYAKDLKAEADIWNYILTCLLKFLVENSMFKQAFPFIRPWIQICRKYLETGVDPNYHCFYVGYIVMGELEMMDELVKYAHKYIEYCMGDDTHDSWTGCVNTALALTGYYIRQQEYYKALTVVRNALKALKNEEQSQGEDLEKKANLLALYSHIQMSIGNFEAALKGYSKVLELYYQLQDTNTRELSVTYNNLGNCYSGMGIYDKAAQYQIKAAQIIKELYGENDKALYIIYSNIANSLKDCEKFQEAEQYEALAQKIKDLHDLDSSVQQCP